MARRTHGLSGSRTYSAWAAMLNRCYNPKHPWFRKYGGREPPVTVCDRWRFGADGLHPVECFVADKGHPAPDEEFHRIDSAGIYEPTNTCWMPHSEHIALHRELSRKRRRADLIEIQKYVTSLRTASAAGEVEQYNAKQITEAAP
jgi:hypothetical protein